jgi:hypothetical protein
LNNIAKTPITMKFLNKTLLSFLVLISAGCGSTRPIMTSDGEYHEAGFFLGILSGLFWPISLLLIPIGWLFPSLCGGMSIYYHYNSGIGYWAGFILGLTPYINMIQKMSGNRDQSQ